MNKNIFGIFTIALFLCSCFSVAQNYHRAAGNNDRLLNIYRPLRPAAANEISFHATNPNARAESSNFFPAKGTHYTWNIPSSTWGILDTTFYTWFGPGLVSSVTRKNQFGIYLTRDLTSYDGANNVIESVHQNWSSGWQNDYRDTSAYDIQGNIVLQLHQTWSAGQWITVASGGAQYLNTYDVQNNLLVHVTQSWDSLSASWNTINRDTSIYNANDQVTQTIRQSWTGSVWNNNSRTIYTYDASFINTQAVDYSWNSGWVNNAQIINLVWTLWTGDISTSKAASYTYQIWNTSSSAWNNDSRFTFTYDGFGGSVETTQIYVASAWQNNARLSEFFDNQFNITGHREEAWNIPFVVWDTTYEYAYTYTYDVNNSITQSIYQQYDIPLHAYVNYLKTDYSDFLFLDVNDIDSPGKTSVMMYPNPVSDFADVFISSDDFSPASYQIYAVAGHMISSQPLREKRFRWNKKNFSPGIYLLIISGTAGETASIKFIVQ